MAWYQFQLLVLILVLVPIYDARHAAFDIDNYSDLPLLNNELEGDSCCLTIFTVHSYKPNKDFITTYSSSADILSFNILAILLLAKPDEFGVSSLDFDRSKESVGVTYN